MHTGGDLVPVAGHVLRRDLAALADRRFDLLVVGCGILGGCIAWDASLRGLSVAVVDKGDFGSGTSSNSLKIVHGGLRYLQHLDLRRMRESIRERSTWLRIAPHLVEPLPVVIPTHGHGLQSRELLRLALAFTDLVSWDRNRNLLPERRLPAARCLSKAECLELVPELAARDLTGGALFFDAQMYNSERLVLEVLQGAAAAGATLANYAEAEGPIDAAGDRPGATVRDLVTGECFGIDARVVVNAAGSSTSAVAANLCRGRSSSAPVFSLAMNLMFPSFGHRTAFAISGEGRDSAALISRGRRHLFIVPWRGHSVIGTAHHPYQGDPGAFVLPERDVEIFLQEVNAAWSGRPLKRSDVDRVHAGLLPVEPRSKDGEVRLLKRQRILRHTAERRPWLISALSVKFTTARLLAQHAVDAVFRFLSRPAPPCRTATTSLPGAAFASYSALLAEARSRYSNLLEPDVLDHLVHTYGSSYERILTYRNSLPDWDLRLVQSAPVINAQLIHGVREEMAVRVEDLLYRRTELGARGLGSELASVKAMHALSHHALPKTGASSAPTANT